MNLKEMNLQCFWLLLATLLLIGCNTAPTEGESNMSEVQEGPEEWLVFEGNTALQKSKKIVLISGDEEYRSEEALPQMAKILAEHHGFDSTVLFAQDPKRPGIVNPNFLSNIPGLNTLEDADLMFIFTRFRDLPNEQMQSIENYLQSGRPVIGIRTATHAFRFKDSTDTWRHYGNYYDGEKTEWVGGFGRLVLGEKWISHHGHHKHQSTKGIIAPGAEDHPITSGLADGDIWGSTDVYGIRLPLSGDGRPIILGQVINREGPFDEADVLYGMRPTDSEVATTNPAKKEPINPNDPMMPIAWTRSFQIPGGKPGKAFASTIGASADLLREGTRRLLVNAVYWSLDMEVPEKAKVDIVGSFEPTQYRFHDDEYWSTKNLKVADLK